MMQIVLVGLGAGAASALLFASVASGSLLSVFLLCLAPLPILIAALGWSHWSALIAAFAAALGLSAAFGTLFFLIAFLIGIGLPAWWLGYLSLLARTSEDSQGQAQVEWYPVGRLLYWCALIAAGMMIMVIPTFGFDAEAFRSGLRTAFERVLIDPQGRLPAGAPRPSGADITRTIDAMVTLAPLIAAAFATIVSALNLYIAARVVRVSGRLARPWPDLSDIRFPATAHAAFAAALVLSFLPGLVGIVGGIFSSALLAGYTLLGLSVLHAITRPLASRAYILFGTYLALAFFWPTVIAAPLLGLADAIFDFRKRAGAGHPPPTTT